MQAETELGLDCFSQEIWWFYPITASSNLCRGVFYFVAGWRRFGGLFFWEACVGQWERSLSGLKNQAVLSQMGEGMGQSWLSGVNKRGGETRSSGRSTLGPHPPQHNLSARTEWQYGMGPRISSKTEQSSPNQMEGPVQIVSPWLAHSPHRRDGQVCSWGTCNIFQQQVREIAREVITLGLMQVGASSYHNLNMNANITIFICTAVIK